MHEANFWKAAFKLWKIACTGAQACCAAQAAGASALAFVVGAGIPLLAAAFIHDYVWRLVSLVRACCALCLWSPNRMVTGALRGD